MRKCPVCSGKQGEILHSQRLVVMDDYPLPPSFDVVLCSACGMVFNRNSATHQNPPEVRFRTGDCSRTFVEAILQAMAGLHGPPADL